MEIFFLVFSILDRLGKLRTTSCSYGITPCEKPSRAGFNCPYHFRARSSEESSAISRSIINILLHHATPTANTDVSIAASSSGNIASILNDLYYSLKNSKTKTVSSAFIQENIDTLVDKYISQYDYIIFLDTLNSIIVKMNNININTYQNRFLQNDILAIQEKICELKELI